MPNDSVSNAPSRHSSKSSMISIKMHLESEHAELAAKAERLQKKQHLEKKETELRAEKEKLELETQMAANTAKLSILKGFEMSQNVPERTERMDGMNEYLEEGLAQHDEQDDYEDTELTQAYAQPAATLDSTTVDQETATRTQEEPVKTITHGSRTMDASVRRKTIHPHQIHYAPLDPTFVTHKPKVPLDVAKDRRPPQTSTIKSSDLFAYPGSHDFMSHGTGTRGGVDSTV